jgi:hypothetical protein
VSDREASPQFVEVPQVGIGAVTAVDVLAVIFAAICWSRKRRRASA